MPVEQRVQEKVLQLNSNPSIDNKTKLAVRKRFYELKEKEIDLEILVETFNESVSVYESQIDKIMSDVVGIIPDVTPKPVTKPKQVEEDDEEIVIPNQMSKTGVKVRMQEELEDDSNEVEEVPYELSQD